MKFNDEQKEVLIEYISVTRSREPSADNVKLAFHYLEHDKVVNVTPNHRQKIKEIAANIKADFERLSDYALIRLLYPRQRQLLIQMSNTLLTGAKRTNGLMMTKNFRS